MKIRIKGNSLRLRLSQSEVKDMIDLGLVEDSINFGSSQLTYRLIKNNTERTSVSFENNVIELSVKSTVISKWLVEQEVGFHEDIQLFDDQHLSVLVEKDFQCLTVRKGEDESDLFQNPAQAHGH
ncbi:MAG: hypothetical protein AAFN93_21275 [Bacteroidota bacterium]